MSSANRGTIRNANDYYRTPIKHIENFLNAAKDAGLVLDLTQILDPCAGGDEENCMSYPSALTNFYGEQKQLLTMDIREDSLAEITCDYLAEKINIKPTLIISNPPFILSEEFVKKAIEDVEEGGLVIFLLRLSFLCTKKRQPLFAELGVPEYAFVHPQRISFTGNGTDSCDYAHFVWRKGNKPSYTKTIILPLI